VYILTFIPSHLKITATNRIENSFIA